MLAGQIVLTVCQVNCWSDRLGFARPGVENTNGISFHSTLKKKGVTQNNPRKSMEKLRQWNFHFFMCYWR